MSAYKEASEFDFAETLRVASTLRDALTRHSRPSAKISVLVTDSPPTDNKDFGGTNAPIAKCVITVKGDTADEAFAGAETLRTEHDCNCLSSGENEFTCDCP